MIDALRDALLQLNDWPAGLKLNYELGKFFCDAFLWFLTLWETGEIPEASWKPHLTWLYSSDQRKTSLIDCRFLHSNIRLLWSNLSTGTTFRSALDRHLTRSRVLPGRHCTLLLAHLGPLYIVQHFSRCAFSANA